MSESRNFQDKYNCQKFKIFENAGWIVSLRPDQKTPFSLLITVKSETFEFRNLTSTQNMELVECYAFIEKLAYDVLNAHKVNYVCLMLVDSIIHIHVFPRFKSDLVIQDFVLKDIFFPKPVDILDSYSINIEEIVCAFSKVKESM